MPQETLHRFNAGPQDAPLTNANTGGTLAGAGTAKFDAGAASEGGFGAFLRNNAGAVLYLDLPVLSPSKSVRERITFTTPDVTPEFDTTLKQWRGDTAGVHLRLYYATNGSIYLQGRSGSAALVLKAGAPLATQYDLAISYEAGAATTSPFDGKLRAWLYLRSNLTLQGSVTSDTYNLGVEAYSAMRLGIPTALANATTQKYDTIRIETDPTSGNKLTELPAYTPPANNPPVVAALTDQTRSVGEAFTITASASDTDGAIDHFTWRAISYPGAAPTFTGGATGTISVTGYATPGVLVFGVTATDNGNPGATSTERTVNVNITAPSGSGSNPNRIVSNAGAWGYGGTATDLVDGLSDAGEWAITTVGPSGAQIVVGFPPQSGTDIVIDFYVDLTDSTGTALAANGQAGTIVAQFFAGSVAITQPKNQVVTNAEAHVVITLTAAENAAFTAAGRTDPRVILTGSAN